MSELSKEARALMESARRQHAPSDADRERVRHKLAAIVGPLPMPSSIAGAGSSMVAKAIVAFALLTAGAVAIGSVFTPRASSEPRPAPVVIPAPAIVPSAPQPSEIVAAPAEPERVPMAPVKQPSKTRPVAAAPRPYAPLDLTEPAAPAVPVAATSLEEELRLLRAAQLARGNPTRALEILDDHARRFPNGALREERIAARVAALCAAGRLDEAREEGERFLAESPRSPYASRIRDSCAGGR